MQWEVVEMKKNRIFFDFTLQFSVGVSSINKPQLYFSDHPAIAIVLNGSIKVCRNGYEKLFNETDVLIIDSSMPVKLSSREGSDIFIMIFNINHFASAFPMISVSTSNEDFIPSKLGFINDIFNLALSSLSSEVANASINNTINSCHSILQTVLNECQFYSAQLTKDSKNKKQYADRIEIMHKLLIYIAGTYDAHPSLETFANELHLSTNYLSHMIKNISGMSFKELVAYIRCCKSQQFLLDNGYRINEIAYDIGFSQPAYFKRNFEKYFNTTPNSFRNIYCAPETPLLAIDTNSEHIQSQIKLFSQTQNITPSLLSDITYTVDFIDVSKAICDFENILSDIGRIKNIRTDINEQTHRTFENMHKDFRMSVITIDALSSLNSTDDSSFLPIAKNINYLINSGFSVAIEVNVFSEQLIKKLSRFLFFYSRIFYGSLPLIKIIIKSKRRDEYLTGIISNIDSVIYRAIGVHLEITTSKDYIDVINYIPELYDSFILTPFAMDELFNPSNWRAEINFSLIDEVNPTGMCLCGGDGLLTWNGIKKPWWYSYMFVSKLHGKIIHQSEDHIITNDNGRIAILTFNLCQKKPDFLKTITSREILRNLCTERGHKRTHSFQICGLSGKYKITSHSLGKTSCLFSNWTDLNYPTYLTDEDEAIISSICHPDVNFKVVDINGTFDLTTVEDSFGVSFIILEQI